jgi:hypothetical protein
MKRICQNCNQPFQVFATSEVSGASFCSVRCCLRFHDHAFGPAVATSGSNKLSESVLPSPTQPKLAHMLGH